MAARMPAKLIFDGRNLYGPERLGANGWAYLASAAPQYCLALII
jgi:hypothetical protein